MSTLKEYYNSRETAKNPRILHLSKFLLDMKVAAGTGTIEEQLTRLMTWVAAKLPITVIDVKSRHSLLEDPLEILLSQSAWCDQHVKVFLWGAKELFGLIGRMLVMQHTDGKNGHTVCEVMLGGRWVLFDPHPNHVACYRKNGQMLGFQEIQDNLDVVINEDHWWTGEDGVGKEGFFRRPVAVYYQWHERRWTEIP
jgi:hypothetical protein